MTPTLLMGGCSEANREDGEQPPSDLLTGTTGGGDQLARGKYLVDSLATCGDCHTPRDEMGRPRADRYLAGVDCFVGVDNPDAGPEGPPGCLSTRNLTNHPTGLKNRTNTHIRDMLLNGKRPNNEFMSGAMPYWILHNITGADADAIIAYLRTVPGIDHAVKPNQFPWYNLPAAVPPIDMATVYTPPRDGNPDYESQMRGRYIAASASGCIECHTPQVGNPPEIDRSRWFAGGRAFPREALKLPPPFPDVIYSTNLTPHATGLGAYSLDQIVTVLKSGRDHNGQGVCPPMPAGPTGPYGTMNASDAMDVAKYLKSLPPVDNARPADCVVPGTLVGFTAGGR
ncbi:hypothetical protein [Pendulispora albinea]|uniref:Cytochrome c domain-containing protein n=1 Tax=Pendulispora albinea TaxID=2741071 RepID=A0ABZ2LTB3_9BACT